MNIRRISEPTDIDNLVTLIDMAWASAITRLSYFDETYQVINELHDLAHVITGGDSTLNQWTTLSEILNGKFPRAHQDSVLRMKELLERIEYESNNRKNG